MVPVQTALTAAQALHFDVYGFVVLPAILDQAEVLALGAALRRLDATADLEDMGVYHSGRGTHSRKFGHLLESDPALLRFATHPALVPLVQEVVGGPVRIEETEAIINRRDPGLAPQATHQGGPVALGFHTGCRPGWGTYEQRGHFRCLFVKTLAYLTDVGPGDGGTAVIPGSHRLAWPEAEIIAAANADPSLIRQVLAPAGSVLLFAESLVHSTTAITSDNERMILVTGYTPTMLTVWPGNEVTPGFTATLPARERNLVMPDAAWPWDGPEP